MTRRELRESVFLLLYMQEFYPGDEKDHQIELYFNNYLNGDFTDEDKAYIEGKTNSILQHVDELDQTIDACAEGWRISRLNRVDLSILRLALYEIRFDDDIPYRVAINEAVEIAKKFGSDESPAFINGILGKTVS